MQIDNNVLTNIKLNSQWKKLTSIGYFSIKKQYLQMMQFTYETKSDCHCCNFLHMTCTLVLKIQLKLRNDMLTWEEMGILEHGGNNTCNGDTPQNVFVMFLTLGMFLHATIIKMKWNLSQKLIISDRTNWATLWTYVPCLNQ